MTTTWNFRTVHYVKIWPDYFKALITGLKPWEARENDRDYRVDDTMVLREWDPRFRRYTGRMAVATITYVTSLPMGGPWVGLTLGGIEVLK
jgi:hypothetical protein